MIIFFGVKILLKKLKEWIWFCLNPKWISIISILIISFTWIITLTSLVVLLLLMNYNHRFIYTSSVIFKLNINLGKKNFSCIFYIILIVFIYSVFFIKIENVSKNNKYICYFMVSFVNTVETFLNIFLKILKYCGNKINVLNIS